MADGSVIIDTGLDKSKINSQMASIKSTLSSGFKSVAKAGAVALGAITAGVVAFGISAEKAFVGFETSMAKVSTLFGDVAVDTESLNAKMLALSDSSGLASEALGESLYSALSAGIPVTEDMGEAMAFLESNTKLAKAGFTDVDTAVSTTAKILNAYNLDVSETDRIHKILMQTQNKGITTVGELGQSLALVTPTAAAFGVSFDNVGASLATMTAQGTPTSQAVTQLNGTIAELGKQGTIASDNLKLAAKAAGLSETSFKGMMESGMSLGDVIKVMGDYAEANNLSMVDMFSSIEAGKGALSLSGANLETFNDNLKAVGTTTDVVGDAYAKMDATIGEQSNKIKNTVKNLGISIMADNRGVLADMVSFANDALSNISQAYGEGGFSGAIKQAVKEAVSGITTLISDGLPQVIQFGGDILKTLASGIWEAMPEMYATVKNVLSGIIDSVASNFPSIVSVGSDIIAHVISGIASAVPAILRKASEVITGFADSLTNGEVNMEEVGGKILNALIEGVKLIAPALWDFTKTIVPALVRIITIALKSMVTVGKDIGKNLLEGFKSGITDMYNSAKESVVNAFTGIIGGVKDFLGIHSPSTLFKQIGIFVMQGFGIGVEDGAGSVESKFATMLANLQKRTADWSATFQAIGQATFNAFGDSLSALGEALVSGEDGWKAFAKAGLLALSDILRAIGNQLAAMAVVEAIKWNFVGAGEAIAGATAAYIASGAVKEWANSYAVGTMALPKDGLYYGHEGETIIPKGITAEAKQAGVVIASRQSIAQGGGMQKLKANITAVFKGNIEMDGTEVARIVFQHTDQNVGLAY